MKTTIKIISLTALLLTIPNILSADDTQYKEQYKYQEKKQSQYENHIEEQKREMKKSQNKYEEKYQNEYQIQEHKGTKGMGKNR